MTKNKTKKQEDWIKEFDKKFCYSEMINGKVVLLIGAEIQPEEIKSFIRNLFQEARQAGFEDGIKEAEKDNTLPKWIEMKIEQARREDRERILKELEGWNQSGYMSDCLGIYWKELIEMINKLK